MSAEVAVEAPPGLQHMGCGFGGPPLSPFQATPGSSNGSNSPPRSPDMKEELIREVTHAVREHIEWKTSAAVDTLWQRGQRAFQHMQQQQLTQTATLRAQLEAHAEGQKKLERDNAMLRQALEALVRRLSGVLAQPQTPQPPHQFQPPQRPMSVCPPPPFGSVDPSQASAFAAAAALAMGKSPVHSPTPVPPPHATESGLASASASAATNQMAAHGASPCQEPAKAPTPTKEVRFDCTPDISEPIMEEDTSFFTTCSPQRAAQDSLATSVPASQFPPSPPPVVGAGFIPNLPSVIGTSPGTPPSVQIPGRNVEQGPQAPTFQVILRRADNVPLGLDVRSDADQISLVVESVRSGGAVEAWNRQCPDTNRIIQAGNRFIKINDAEDSESMRSECVNKHLLRITVHRRQPLVNQHIGNLRADADEFVPSYPAATSSC